MSKRREEILQKLRELSLQDPVIFPGVVKSVDESTLTCEVEINELEFTCRLNAAQSSVKGFVLIPSVSSTVLVGRIDEKGDVLVLIAATSVEKIIMREGNNGGLINISGLVSNLNKLTARVDGIIDAIKNGVVVAQDGGANLKTTIVTALNLLTDKENFSDIEDGTILH
jgi:hypothetical protein